MKISTAAKAETLKKRIALLKDNVYSSLVSLDMDPDLYADEEAVLENLTSNVKIVENHQPERFRQGYRLYDSVNKVGMEDHWAYPICSATDTHLNRPIDEMYGRHDFFDLAESQGLLGVVTDYVKIIEAPGIFSIICTVVNPDKPALVEQLNQVHPYSVSPNLHELFKLMLEWQWAYKHLDADEPMAVKSNEALEYLGLDVDDTSNQVVVDLMNLPDLHVVDYLNGLEYTTKTEFPEAPQSFIIWAARKHLIQGTQKGIAQLYDHCIALRNARVKLNSL